VLRPIITIDEDKCTGCGDCITACAEAALQIIDGKARLINDVYCDGLGACLGECPEGAIAIEDREAEGFDEEAVRSHLVAQWTAASAGRGKTAPTRPPAACPSTRLSSIESAEKSPGATDENVGLPHWPIKLRLVPPEAPFLKDADVVLVADCVAFARAPSLREILPGRALLIGCPKLDDWDASLERLVGIVSQSIRSVTVVHMEVPCCSGYWQLAQQALEAAGVDLPLGRTVVGVGGDVVGTEALGAGDA